MPNFFSIPLFHQFTQSKLQIATRLRDSGGGGGGVEVSKKRNTKQTKKMPKLFIISLTLLCIVNATFSEGHL